MYHFSASVLIVLILSAVGLSLPFELKETELTEHHRLSKRADDFFLRILPLGASITWGLKSSTGNG